MLRTPRRKGFLGEEEGWEGKRRKTLLARSDERHFGAAAFTSRIWGSWPVRLDTRAVMLRILRSTFVEKPF